MRADVKSIGLAGVTNLAVLAPVKPGFVEGFESMTYLERLRRLLESLQSARQNLRESELRNAVFPDSIGRFGIIHSFRYAIVPPRDAPASDLDEPGISLLSLNVTFDGGWEPYMRVIYRDLGPLLDALFCHCDGYPGSQAPFDLYCRWVRDNELGDGLFYADATVSLADQRYLAEVEKLQRETPVACQADGAIARFAVDPLPRQIAHAFEAVAADPESTLALPVRTLKGLYRLSTWFPSGTGDGGVLIRFAQSLLAEFRAAIASPALQNSSLWPPIAQVLADELRWLGLNREPPAPVSRLPYSPSALQDMILHRDDPVTHGCVVLLAVRGADRAVAHLASLAPLCAVPANADAIRYHLAFTFGGLQRLGIAGGLLDQLPPEFAEGMEARCALLGDVRGNHPDHWLRPQRYGAKRPDMRIDLTAVHVAAVLRLNDPATESAELHPRLALAVDELQRAGSGLTVLSVQPTRSYRKNGQTREHFGFADGFSQPVVVAPDAPTPRTDEIRPGELLLGHLNDRGDGPFPAGEDDFLDNGSFLVLRKLRQRVDHLETALGAQPAKADLLARMMGRRQDGTSPLAPGGGNAFNYDGDPHGEACPFSSHVRRANPRDGRKYLPRILRRGMSYGRQTPAETSAERGVMFMAYCASIAEQFETLQRWIAGGNSSGVSSSQADPFLAVPRPGEKRTFRYIDAAGQVARVDLGTQPFVELEWGLYLFAPSLKALRMLASFRKEPHDSKERPVTPEPPDDLETWRRRLEDPKRAVATWARVRDRRGARMEAPPYGRLLGSAKGVLDVLRAGPERYSVRGYGERMDGAIGLNHLGMDPTGDADDPAEPVNRAIEKIGEREAFHATARIVEAVLKKFALLGQAGAHGSTRMPVDLVTLSERVLAALCVQWIGLPTPSFMDVGGRVDDDQAPDAAAAPPRCPGHLLTASRYTFTPHPDATVEAAGRKQGAAVLEAVKQWLAAGATPGPLAVAIQQGLKDIDPHKHPDIVARSLAGVLLGFPPTVYGNFLQTMKTWIEDKLLWACQQQLAEVPAAVTDPYERARRGLRETLLTTMRGHPLPEVLWRCPVVDGKAVLDTDKRVMLGIASALTDAKAPHELMFGGSRSGKLKTLHACPGYGMGMGVMLALIAGLLEAGTLRPTGSPVLLMLTPRAN